ncbi:MAG: C2 family cysteine protease [Elusimicrobiota bacterium]|nr:C2 family cysteine protease [Elusimicrobiota bacterium]
MLKKYLYLVALAFSFYAAQNAGLAAEETAAGVQWRASSYTCWDYLEQRQEVDEAAWDALTASEQKTMLTEGKKACAEAGKSVKLLSSSPLDGDRLLEIDSEGEADAKACFRQEGGLLSEKLRILRGINARRENGALTENDVNWLEDNDVSWAGQYKEALKIQALKPKLGEDSAKQQKKLDKFNADGTGKRLSGISSQANQGDTAAIGKFFDGGAARGEADPAGSGLAGKGLSLKPGVMATAGKTPEEQKLELMQKGKAPPLLGGKPPENPQINKAGIVYQKIEGNLYATGANKTGDMYTMAINQGNTGDCYFLASAAAIAKKDPDFIRNSITENKDGTYSVDFYREKPWYKFWGPAYTKETVTVDNQFPTNAGKPEFNNSKGTSDTGKRENMWGMVYEKAYAKFQGSYTAIGEGGWPSAAMAEITGKASTTQSSKSTSLEKIAEWEKKGYAIAAGSYKTPTNLGVVGGHAYYILGVDTVKGTVTMGNPWGFKNVTLTEAEFQANYADVYVNTIQKE